MVAISWQYLSGADKAVQIRRSVFVDKGAQPELRHNNIEIPLSVRISDLPFACSVWVKTFSKFSILLTFCVYTTRLEFLEALTF